MMTIREIIVSVLRKHLITRKIAEKIADEITAEVEIEYNRQVGLIGAKAEKA